MEIGERIKNLRIMQGLTQEELADRSELTKGFISQLERDLTSPSINTLVDLLESLGTNLKDFFQELDDERYVFIDEDMSESINEEYGHKITWIIPNAQKNEMEPILIEIEPKGQSKEILPFEGEEFGYVIDGEVELCIDDEILHLSTGETFYLRGKKTHYLKNVSNKKCKVIWVSSPPNF